MDIHKTIEEQFYMIEIEEIQQMLKKKSHIITSQKYFLRAFLIKGLSAYIRAKMTDKKYTISEYTYRIKGICMMALYICEQFNYLDKRSCEEYKKILNR